MVGLCYNYVVWHYSRAVVDLFRNWSNMVWFVFTFFSLPLLFRTLFAPFRRLDEGYEKGFNPEQWAGTFIVNTLMRFVGACVRLFVIVLGIVVLAVVLCGGFFLLLTWLVAPLLVVLLVGIGFTFLTL